MIKRLTMNEKFNEVIKEAIINEMKPEDIDNHKAFYKAVSDILEMSDFNSKHEMHSAMATIYGETPLTYAVKQRAIELVNLSLEIGASPDALNIFNESGNRLRADSGLSRLESKKLEKYTNVDFNKLAMLLKGESIREFSDSFNMSYLEKDFKITRDNIDSSEKNNPRNIRVKEKIKKETLIEILNLDKIKPTEEIIDALLPEFNHILNKEKDIGDILRENGFEHSFEITQHRELIYAEYSKEEININLFKRHPIINAKDENMNFDKLDSYLEDNGILMFKNSEQFKFTDYQDNLDKIAKNVDKLLEDISPQIQSIPEIDNLKSILEALKEKTKNGINNW